MSTVGYRIGSPLTAAHARELHDRRRHLFAKREGIALGISSTLATATQLRAAGTVGPGELALVGVIVLALAFGETEVGGALRLLTARVSLILISMSTVGGLFATWVFDEGTRNSLVGIAALSLLTASAMFVATRPLRFEMLRHWGWWFATTFVASQMMLFLASRTGVAVPVFQPIYYNVRFQGWTNNPNQLAMLCVVAAAAALMATQRAWQLRVVVMSGALVLAVESKSDGFRLAAVAALLGVSMLVALGSARRVKLPTRIVALLGSGLAMVLATYRLPTLLATASGVASSGNQGSDRLALWKACIHSFLRAPLTGLGPGAHSSLPTVSGPIECHNTSLDVAASAGLPALVALLTLFVVLLVRSWRRGDGVSLATLLSLAIMLSFGYLLRYPQLWLLLALIETRVAQPAPTGQRT